MRKNIMVLVVMFLLAVPAAMAQRGQSDTRNRGTPNSAPSASRGNYGGDRLNSSRPAQVQPRFQGQGSEGRRIAPPPPSVRNYWNGWYGRRGDYHRGYGFWFPGRLYLGAWYPAGYYYPGYWYLGDWYAYEFYIDDQLRFSGLKIELGAIQESERDAVKQGVVYVDGIEMGTVKQFTGIWHEPLPLAPGSHEVVVRLADGRELATTLGIVPGHVTRLLLRFNKPAPKPNPNLDLGPSYE